MVSFPRAGVVRIAVVPKPMAAAVVEVINVLRFIFGFNSSAVGKLGDYSVVRRHLSCLPGLQLATERAMQLLRSELPPPSVWRHRLSGWRLGLRPCGSWLVRHTIVQGP